MRDFYLILWLQTWLRMRRWHLHRRPWHHRHWWLRHNHEEHHHWWQQQRSWRHRHWWNWRHWRHT
jgi:hypothetical protein